MSLATWKQEFYPTKARDCPAEEAIAHSLRKWQGLRADALERHGVTVDGEKDLTAPGERAFFVNANSCALCNKFYDEYTDSPCSECPLAISRGAACDKSIDGGEDDAPWWAWTGNGDPEPMIAALEAAAKATGSAA